MNEFEIEKKILEGVSVMHDDVKHGDISDLNMIVGALLQLQQRLNEIRSLENANTSSIH